MARPGGTIVKISGLNPVDDPKYRYEMPCVYGKIEGRGNGIKTVIPNISKVALSLHRQPGEVNKFFGCNLGAQTTYNADTDRAVVNGAHTDAVLQNLIHRYVEVFVLCPNCGLPETDYKIKSEIIYHKCAACGSKEMVDMRHKLCTYILAHHKKAKTEVKSSDKKGKKDKDDKKKKKKKKKKEGSDDERKEKKKKDKKKDKKEKKKGKNDKSKDDHLEDAVSEQKSEEFDDADDVSVGSHEDDADALALAVEATRKYLQDHPDAGAEEIAELVTNQQHASALKSHDKVHIITQAAISPNFFKEREIEKYAPAISEVTNGNCILERHLIAALEGLCVSKPKNFPVMLKQMYDEDALEEDSILEWAGEGRSAYTSDTVDEETRAVLRGLAEPVVVWLQEADSDDDDGW